jgi:uncharacterized protein (DUF1778 family)
MLYNVISLHADQEHLMSSIPEQSSTRLDFRLSQAHKDLIEQAASMQGQTISSFAISSLLKTAEEVIQREHTRTLSQRDAKVFLNLLEASPEPNQALKSAVKRYKAARGR